MGVKMLIFVLLLALLAFSNAFNTICPSVCTCKWKNGKSICIFISINLCVCVCIYIHLCNTYTYFICICIIIHICIFLYHPKQFGQVYVPANMSKWCKCVQICKNCVSVCKYVKTVQVCANMLKWCNMRSAVSRLQSLWLMNVGIYHIKFNTSFGKGRLLWGVKCQTLTPKIWSHSWKCLLGKILKGALSRNFPLCQDIKMCALRKFSSSSRY